MTSDLLDELHQADVVFSLTHGLDDEHQYDLINPLRFGQQRWIDVKAAKFSMFNLQQVNCIIAYLQDRAKFEDQTFACKSIEQSIINYWGPRRNWLKNAEQGGVPQPPQSPAVEK